MSLGSSRLILGNSQFVGFGYDFVKKLDHLSLGLEVDMGDGLRSQKLMLDILSLQVDFTKYY